ncbi:MAG: hypothetical protein ACLR6B_16400 [Blautia sp.]
MYGVRSSGSTRKNGMKQEVHWTVKNDPRVTGIVEIYAKNQRRRASSAFNVLKGDMSLAIRTGGRKELYSLWKSSGKRFRGIW